MPRDQKYEITDCIENAVYHIDSEYKPNMGSCKESCRSCGGGCYGCKGSCGGPGCKSEQDT